MWLCVPNQTEDMNVTVFNIIIEIDESKSVVSSMWLKM